VIERIDRVVWSIVAWHCDHVEMYLAAWWWTVVAGIITRDWVPALGWTLWPMVPAVYIALRMAWIGIMESVR